MKKHFKQQNKNKKFVEMLNRLSILKCLLEIKVDTKKKNEYQKEYDELTKNINKLANY